MNKTRKYKTLESWANAMRKDTKKTLWADWFNIAGHWYTCEEYDESGQYMRYTSVTDGYHLDLETNNRYSKNWLSDLKVTKYAIEDLRFGISYYIADIKEFKRKDLMLLNIWLWDRKMYTEMRDLIDHIANNLN
jgi:hypothetical protein